MHSLILTWQTEWHTEIIGLVGKIGSGKTILNTCNFVNKSLAKTILLHQEIVWTIQSKKK